MLPPHPNAARHARQERFAPLGPAGQAALARSSAVVVGCGALGSVAADLLARAGVGRLRLVDRDVLELSNLHRQALFTEEDVRAGLPKAVAAAARLRAIDSALEAEPLVEDLDGANALRLLEGADVVLDGTDNFETRHVLNEACLHLGLPWVHAACLGATAVAWPLRPGTGGPCLACAFPDAPAPGDVETCETAGVLGPAVHLAAAVQVAEAMKLLSGATASLLPGPWTWDAWEHRGAVARVGRDPGCPACVLGERRFLGRSRAAETVACGRSAVQVAWAGTPPDLDAVQARLAGQEGLLRNRWLLRFRAEGRDVTLFRDGRVLVGGTREPAVARALASRWLGG